MEHFVASQIGSGTGKIVADGLIEATEHAKTSEKNVKNIYQDMTIKSDGIISRWKIPLFIISLPIKPLINPLLNEVRKSWIYKPVFSDKISKEQLKIRLTIIHYIATGLNSLAVGVLIYLGWRLIYKPDPGRTQCR